MPAASPDQLQLHATAVALDGRAVLITGPSGSGKSALALQLIGFGAMLVSDDTVFLRLDEAGRLIARSTPATRGMIEARGVGLLKTASADDIPVTLAVDLALEERDRLPNPQTRDYLGVTIPCLHKVAAPYFPAAILQMLKTGRAT